MYVRVFVCVCVLEDKVCVLNYPNVISLAMFLRSSPVPQGCVCVSVCVCVCEFDVCVMCECECECECVCVCVCV